MKKSNTIKKLPYTYWVEKNKILAGQYPGSLWSKNPIHNLRTLFDYTIAITTRNFDVLHSVSNRVISLLNISITKFVDLTEENELEEYVNILNKEGSHKNIKLTYTKISIKDKNIPSVTNMEKALKILHSASTEKRVYLHCLRGLGRTGTVVGCYLIEKGLTTEEALNKISSLRKGTLGSWWKSPELNLQINFIKRWELRTKSANRGLN